MPVQFPPQWISTISKPPQSAPPPQAPPPEPPKEEDAFKPTSLFQLFKKSVASTAVVTLPSNPPLYVQYCAATGTAFNPRHVMSGLVPNGGSYFGSYLVSYAAEEGLGRMGSRLHLTDDCAPFLIFKLAISGGASAAGVTPGESAAARKNHADTHKLPYDPVKHSVTGPFRKIPPMAAMRTVYNGFVITWIRDSFAVGFGGLGAIAYKRHLMKGGMDRKEAGDKAVNEVAPAATLLSHPAQLTRIVFQESPVRITYSQAAKIAWGTVKKDPKAAAITLGARYVVEWLYGKAAVIGDDLAQGILPWEKTDPGTTPPGPSTP